MIYELNNASKANPNTRSMNTLRTLRYFFSSLVLSGLLLTPALRAQTFTDLYDFSAGIGDFANGDVESNPDGARPAAGVTLVNNVLYGTTEFGGTNTFGVIFGYNPSTFTYSNLYDFTGGTGSGAPSPGA